MKRLSFALTLALLTTPSLASPAPLCSQVFTETSNNLARANQLLEASLKTGPGQADVRKELQQLLKLDDLNFIYYMALFEKRFEQKSDSAKLYPATDSGVIAYPVGSRKTPAEINSQFKPTSYDEVLKGYTGRYATNTLLILKKLQAGTGSSMTRQKYFEANPQMAEAMGLPEGTKLVLGAKGTDLLATIPHPKNPSQMIQVPIAEVQLLQAYKMAIERKAGRVVLQDIVGPETRNRLNAIWSKKSLIDSTKTYAQLFDSQPALGRMMSVYQAHVPVLDAAGKISFNRVSPAGHGLFAVDALRAVLHPFDLPLANGRPVIAAIANGEDLNSLPDAAIVDWTVRTRAPIVLVTTTKTGSDKKGGIFVLLRNSKTGELYPKVLDTAEAKAVGQLEEFEKAEGIASTNLTLFNYEVLNEKLRNIPEAELLKAMAPDLVPNKKTQVDSDGVEREYTQLEGTMGTVILNLDRYYRKHFNESLVQVVNVDTNRRTDFFAPIKSAFDYFLQFHSSRFKLDTKDYKLKNQGGAEPPKATFTDTATKNKAWEDVQFVLGALKGLNPTRLQEIELKDVTIASIKIEAIGSLKIINESGHRIDLSQIQDHLKNFPRNSNGEITLKDAEIRISPQGVSIKSAQQQKGMGVAYARVGTSGSHTDYNFGLTLAALLPVKTESIVTPRNDNIVSVESSGSKANYELGKESPVKDWSGYIQGITHVMREEGIELKGFDLKISSNIPFGAGISSSAALVVSVMKALRSAYDLKIDDLQIAKMGQKVEHFLGAKTGLLDQMTISLLDQDRDSALLIDFSTMKSQKVKMAEDAEFIIIHSGLTHSLTDNHGTRNYSTRRAETEEAAKILGVPHLSKISLQQLEARKSELSPLLYKRAHHVVSENERVKRLVEASSRGDLKTMGQVMNESHQSQRDDYDISEKPIDAFVSILQNTPGVYGASLTGGGFGGAVFALVKKGTGAAIAQKAMKDYLAAPENDGQYQPKLISPSAETK